MNEIKTALLIMILWLLFLFVIAVSGCVTVCYIRIGPQKLDKVQITLESQEADPNIPEIKVRVGVL